MKWWDGWLWDEMVDCETDIIWDGRLCERDYLPFYLIISLSLTSSYPISFICLFNGAKTWDGKLWDDGWSWDDDGKLWDWEDPPNVWPEPGN